MSQSEKEIVVPSFLPHFAEATHRWVCEFDVPYVQLFADFVTDPVLLGFTQPAQGEGAVPTIVLNVNPAATGNLNFGPEYLTFNCRFGGKEHNVVLAYQQIAVMYGRTTLIGQPVCDYASAKSWFENFGDGQAKEDVPVKSKPSLKLVH